MKKQENKTQKTNESLLSLRSGIHLNSKNLNLFNFTLCRKNKLIYNNYKF